MNLSSETLAQFATARDWMLAEQLLFSPPVPFRRARVPSRVPENPITQTWGFSHPQPARDSNLAAADAAGGSQRWPHWVQGASDELRARGFSGERLRAALRDVAVIRNVHAQMRRGLRLYQRAYFDRMLVSGFTNR